MLFTAEFICGFPPNVDGHTSAIENILPGCF